MRAAREGLPEGVSLTLETRWMKRSPPHEERGTVFQAEGTEGAKRSA